MTQPADSVSEATAANEETIRNLDMPSTAYILMYNRILKAMLCYSGTDALREFDLYGEDFVIGNLLPVSPATLNKCTFGSGRTSVGRLPKFLNKYDKEPQEVYEARVNNSFFYGAFRESVDWQTGRVFSREIQLKEGYPEQIDPFLEDVDGSGNSLNIFCQNVFKDSIIKGFSNVLVDFPVAQPGQTAADDRQRMPRLVHVKPENLLAAYRDEDGELYHAKIIFNKVAVDENGNEFCLQILNVFNMVDGVVVHQMFSRDGQDGEFLELTEGPQVLSLSYIPLLTFYSTPPEMDYVVNNVMNDLIDLNISHYRQTSSYLFTLERTACPTLVAKGLDPQNEQVIVGPGRSIITQNEQADVSWMEYNGSSIESARSSISDTERKMATIGSDILTGQPGTMTATQRAIDSAQQNSRVESLAKQFQDFLTDVLSVAGEWMIANGTISEAEAEAIIPDVYSDFSFTDSETDNIRNILLPLYQDGRLSESAFFDILRSKGIFPQDFDIEKNREEVDQSSVLFFPSQNTIDEQQNGSEDDI